jgi:thiol:disulfide interchange protein DsbD
MTASATVTAPAATKAPAPAPTAAQAAPLGQVPPGAAPTSAANKTVAGSPAAGTPANVQAARDAGLWAFLWFAMTMGLVSLATPCVFPMMPITVSYFTKNAIGSRRKAIGQAGVFMGGIVLTFTALGMAMALLAGAASLNRFAANPWVNLLITGIFLVFAASLFGNFDLQLPNSWVNRVDALTRNKGGSGTVATLLMGFTFTLTSFTCTAPFIGTLLVMAGGGDWLWPLLGMLAFSAVLRAGGDAAMDGIAAAGGRINSVKVVMAFLEVAAAMKFLSNVDLVWGWGVFTRDVVLATWVALLVLMALYLIGLFRFAHDSPVEHVGLGRLTATVVTSTLALWLLTGLWGKPLGELDAFLPPPVATLSAQAAGAEAAEPSWVLNDYEGALKRAKAEGRPVFIDFTGYTCTNCRWMELNMFPRADVRDALAAFVRVRLYTDGEGEIFQRQQQIQQSMYKTVALPFYAVVTADGQPVVSFAGLTRDAAEFVAFLRSGTGAATERPEQVPAR